MGRVSEEDEQSRPTAFFSPATERRSNGVMGRCHRSAHLVQARGSSEEGAIGRLLPVDYIIWLLNIYKPN
jgi:hypothetical protein